VAEYGVSKFLILPIFGQNFFPLLSNKQKLFIKLTVSFTTELKAFFDPTFFHLFSCKILKYTWVLAIHQFSTDFKERGQHFNLNNRMVN
jgi:hypothetical protein